MIELPNATREVEALLLHVFDEADRAEEASSLQLRAAERAYKRLQEAGITVEPVTRHGDPATQIIEAAEEHEADLILLGGRKRSTLGPVLFGSVSQQVTLDANRPIVVTGDRRQRQIPSHRCQSCDEEYYTELHVEITSCRNCGGTKIEPPRERGSDEPPKAT